MIIRAKTFKNWMQSNFTRSQLTDMCNHGVDTGWAGLTYYSDTCKLYNKFKDEIWKLVADDYEQSCNQSGEPNLLHFISNFGGARDVSSIETFENLMVWFAAEHYARVLSEDQE